MRSIAVAAFLLFVSGCVGSDAPVVEVPQPTYEVPSALPKVDASATLAELRDFAFQFPDRSRNSDTHKGSREALAKDLEAANLTLFRQTFAAGSTPLEQENVCGIQLGFHTDSWVIVGAHYDTTVRDPVSGASSNTPVRDELAQRSQGAYDDGSGTRMVVSLAKTLAGIQPYHSILYCLFDGEERGTQGSQALHEAMSDGDFPYPVDRVHAMLDLDMFGINWPVRTSIWFDTKTPKLRAAAETLRQELGIPDRFWKSEPIRSGQSDFRWWYKDGTPTVFFISNFEEWMAPVPGGAPETVPMVETTYPFWHQADTYENMERMAGGADLLQAGFQTALDLTTGILRTMAYQGDAPLA